MSPDTGFTNYAQVAADGTVQFDFPGHVSAEGIDMIAAPTSAAASDDNMVRWHVDTMDGEVRAEILAFDAVDPGAGLYLRAANDDVQPPATLSIAARAITGLGTIGAEVHAGGLELVAQATILEAEVGNENGVSDFTRSALFTVDAPLSNTPIGALGVTGFFTLPAPSLCLIDSSGSGFVGGTGLYLLDVVIDSGAFTGQITHYFNSAGVHQHMGRRVDAVTLDTGSHSVAVIPAPGLSTDNNDHCTVSVLAVPLI